MQAYKRRCVEDGALAGEFGPSGAQSLSLQGWGCLSLQAHKLDIGFPHLVHWSSRLGVLRNADACTLPPNPDTETDISLKNLW